MGAADGVPISAWTYPEDAAFAARKGAWVLHMLRRKLGDEPFFRGLRRFYGSHAGGTATTEDLRRALEAEGGIDLAAFLRQWLHRPDLPDLSVAWRWDAATREVVLEVAQAGEPYELDFDLAFRSGEQEERRTVSVGRAWQTLRVRSPDAPRPWRPTLTAGSCSRPRPRPASPASDPEATADVDA
jgi:aminopeptidase N